MFACQMQIERIKRHFNDARKRQIVARQLVYRRVAVPISGHGNGSNGNHVNGTGQRNSKPGQSRQPRVFRTITEWRSIDSAGRNATNRLPTEDANKT